MGHNVPEPLWWHLQHLHPSDLGSDAETCLAFQTHVLLLHCYGVTGISVCIQFCKPGQDRIVLLHCPKEILLIAKSSQGENMVQAQPRLKKTPTLQLEYQTLPQESQCCFVLEKTLRMAKTLRPQVKICRYIKISKYQPPFTHHMQKSLQLLHFSSSLNDQ